MVFEEAVKRVPEVMKCYLMTGQQDYLLRVVVSDPADFERLHSQHLTRLPGVARVQSSFALRTVRKSAELPVLAVSRCSRLGWGSVRDHAAGSEPAGADGPGCGRGVRRQPGRTVNVIAAVEPMVEETLYATPTLFDRVGRVVAEVEVNDGLPLDFIVDTGDPRRRSPSGRSPALV